MALSGMKFPPQDGMPRFLLFFGDRSAWTNLTILCVDAAS
jgi:hypothetical protein